MRASIGASRSCALLSLIRTSDAAPSEIDEELAAVTVPSFLNAGRRAGIFSGSARPGPSSSDISASPFRVLTVTSSSERIGNIVDAYYLHARMLCPPSVFLFTDRESANGDDILLLPWVNGARETVRLEQ